MSTPILSLVEAQPVLQVQGIGKTYAEPVLADISLELRAGEVLALTGENGAGRRSSVASSRLRPVR
jgi:ribose transport system ATP-binding protein